MLSEKDGWRHAYVHSRDGQQQALLTPGDFDIIERARLDEAGGWFYYYASPDNATQKYLYRVRLDGTVEPRTGHSLGPTRHPRLRLFSRREVGVPYLLDIRHARQLPNSCSCPGTRSCAYSRITRSCANEWTP